MAAKILHKGSEVQTGRLVRNQNSITNVAQWQSASLIWLFVCTKLTKQTVIWSNIPLCARFHPSQLYSTPSQPIQMGNTEHDSGRGRSSTKSQRHSRRSPSTDSPSISRSRSRSPRPKKTHTPQTDKRRAPDPSDEENDIPSTPRYVSHLRLTLMLTVDPAQRRSQSRRHHPRGRGRQKGLQMFATSWLLIRAGCMAVGLICGGLSRLLLRRALHGITK